MATSSPHHSSSHRASTTTNRSVNLYCAGCDSKLGVFENEWIRITTSYARAKDKGTHLATEIGNKTQIVPTGQTRKVAEGCTLSETFCMKCSALVGQYCRDAPTRDQKHLIGEYFFKLSRIYLKDCHTRAQVDPVFGFGGDVSPSQRETSRSNASPIPTWSRGQSLLRNVDYPRKRTSDVSVSRKARSQPSTTALDSTEEDTLALNWVNERDTVIEKLSQQVESLQKEIEQFKATLKDVKTSGASHASIGSSEPTFVGNFDALLSVVKESLSERNELEALRSENFELKAKLQTIASAMGPTDCGLPPTPAATDSMSKDIESTSSLGKRKRQEKEQGLSVTTNGATSANSSRRASNVSVLSGDASNQAFDEPALLANFQNPEITAANTYPEQQTCPAPVPLQNCSPQPVSPHHQITDSQLQDGPQPSTSTPTEPVAKQSLGPDPLNTPRADGTLPYPPNLVIDLDNASITTPDQIAQKLSDKELGIKRYVTHVQSTERKLNMELTRLGLERFIGKDKKDQEYRRLVNEAREKTRESEKARRLNNRRQPSVATNGSGEGHSHSGYTPTAPEGLCVPINPDGSKAPSLPNGTPAPNNGVPVAGQGTSMTEGIMIDSTSGGGKEAATPLPEGRNGGALTRKQRQIMMKERDRIANEIMEKEMDDFDD